MTSCRPHRPPTAERRSIRGSALFIVLVATVIISGVVYSGVLTLQATQQQSEATFRVGGQAYHVARAGIIDAFSWFRRQTSQPVTTFAPQRDLTADPPLIETDDPSIGIVRTFPISGGVWGRYEVRTTEVKDISSERGFGTSGGVWLIRSHGIVYRLRDDTKNWDEAPNHVLGRETLVTEIRRVTIAPPAQAALCIARGDGLTLYTNGRIEGGPTAGGAVFPPSTGTPTLWGELLGTPPQATLVGYDWSVDAVFGLDFEALKSLADDRIFVSDDFPSPVARNSFLYFKGDLTFTNARPLRGQGVLVVEGDITISAASNSFFTGFIYCTGHIDLRAPSLLRGAIVCESLEILGAGDFAEMGYDEGVLSNLMSQVGQYRMSKAIHSPGDWE